MLAIYDLCKGKKICEAGSLDTLQDENLPPDDTERMKKMVSSLSFGILSTVLRLSHS